MKDLENGVVISASVCNWGCGWKEPEIVCDRCGEVITNEEVYQDYFGDKVCAECFHYEMDE